MPSLRPPSVAKVTVQELGFRPEMVLGESFGIGLELFASDRLTSLAIECSLGGCFGIAVKRGNWLCIQGLSRSPAFGRRALQFLGQFEFAAE